ncbi:hypothetical protein D3C87_1305350 [compost metagenome]
MERICVASRSRCSSPGDRVGVERSIARYPRPSACKVPMRSTRSCAMRCAAMRFSGEESGVRRTSVLPACARPPAATRLALSFKPAALLRVEPAALPARPSKRPSAAGVRTSAIRLSGNWDRLPISRPAKVTDRASRLSRRPPHSGQGAPVMNRATRFFIMALCVVAKVCIT